MIVNAVKTITYNVNAIRETIAEMNEIAIEDVPMQEALDMLEQFVIEDFGDSYGVFLIDEEGNEL
jgi:hypothetical protein